MSTTSTTWQYLERDPKSSYKQLSIKGRRIRARTLYGRYMSEEEPRTVEEIARDYDLPIEAVREAIAYCESDPPEIREDFACEEALMEASRMNTKEASWAAEDTAKCKRIWHAYQKQHDLSDRVGKTAGIDPESGRVWIGDSALDVVSKRDADGFTHPLFFERIGHLTYLRKGGHR